VYPGSLWYGENEVAYTGTLVKLRKPPGEASKVYLRTVLAAHWTPLFTAKKLFSKGMTIVASTHHKVPRTSFFSFMHHIVILVEIRW
jgi:hypothetical protein